MRLMCRQLFLLIISALLMATSKGHYNQEVKSWRISHYKQILQDNHAPSYSIAATKEKLLPMNKAGPGSHPPTCTRKCGPCTSCHPVHVPVPPGATSSSEYYPEAWRCKCGNHLYIP